MSIARLMQQAAAGVPTGDVWTDPDLANASYDSVSFSVSGQETSPQGLFFKPDGTKLYVIGLISDAVNEYSLSSAWDISTASYVQNFSVLGEEASPRDLFFKPDGTQMYIVGSSGDDVNEYSLSSAWDVSTASYVQNFSVSGQETNPQGLFFKPDGTKMYVLGATGDDVNEYDLSTAWNISTASYVQNFSVSGQDTFPAAIFFNPDGYKMYVLGDIGDFVNEYDLSIPWDISSASYTQNFSVAGQETSPQGLFFKSDGSKMYIVGTSTDTIYQYSTVTPAAPSWTDPDLANASYDSVSFSVAGQDTISTSMAFKPDGTKFYVSGSAGDDVNEYDLSTAWDVSSASYVQNFSVVAQETSPQGITFKPDGTKMYIVGAIGDDINEYDLSSAWDISTASYVQNFSVAAQEVSPQGIAFKPDGTKFYVSGSAGDDVNEYDLSTAWDVSSASYVQNFSVVAQETSPQGITFKPDGTKMYIVGVTADTVYEYSLSSPWDISTASYNSISFSVNTQDTGPQIALFKSDGSKMYVLGATNNTIYQYSTD